MSKTTKPTQPIRLASQTKEEKEMQIARFLSNKKESFFQLILANLLQNPAIANPNDGHIVLQEIIDSANDGADYILTKLYTVEKKED